MPATPPKFVRSEVIRTLAASSHSAWQPAVRRLPRPAMPPALTLVVASLTCDVMSIAAEIEALQAEMTALAAEP